MSVINQMLVDLDRRRASGEERNRIPDHVRALPDEARISRGPVVRVVAGAVAAGLALLAAGTWWWPGPRSPAVVVSAPAPVAAPVQERETEFIARRLTLDLAYVPEDSGGMPAGEAAPAVATATVIPPRRAPAPVPSPVEEPRAAPVPTPKKAADAQKVQLAPARVEIDKQIREPTPRQRAETEYAKGVAALHRGQSGDARAAFETTLQIDPAHHGARQALVGMLLEARRQDDAGRILQEGLQLAPAQHGFAMALARLQVENGELDAAVQTLARSLDYPGVSPDYLAFYAGLLQRQQKHAEAVAQFQRALGQRGNVGVWLLGIGVSLEALGRLPEAQEAFRRAKASGNLSPDLQTFADQRLR